MSRKITKTVIEEPQDAPGVLAYRVGQLEKAVADSAKTTAEGLLGVHSKLDMIKDGFVSHDQLEEAVKLANKTHENHEKRISDLEDDKKWLQRMIYAALVLSVLATLLGTKFLAGFHG